MKVRVEFKRQDMWVGAYWRRWQTGADFLDKSAHYYTDVWLCLVPMFPIHFTNGPRYQGG